MGTSAFIWAAGGWNPDLGVGTPRPPVEERNAAPQTPLRKVRLVCGEARFALVRSVGYFMMREVGNLEVLLF